MGFEQELKIVARAYNQAQQGLQSTAQGINQVSQAANQAVTASQRLNQAFGNAMKTADGYKQAASGLILPIDKVADANRRTASEAKKASEEAKKAGKGFEEQSKGAKGANDAMQDFYQTLGSLGALRGLQVALQGLVGTYRQYSAEARQAGLIAEDYTGTLRRQAMAATQGMYGPRELTNVYREIGSAGLAAADVIAGATPTIQFATAAMIDQADAAQAVIAAASSFNIPFSQADRITNAFAEAMNRTTLGGRDLVYALASIGPVAGMAGQGLGETLGAVAALRNAGAQAQDAATSVRAAMLHMANPSDEARAAMQALGIEVYDAQGQMKQWSAIVAEFERALQPYNQQTRQMALATILGSDGIRAMAASMQFGSSRLEELAGQFDNAEGSASRMAGAMEETLDGAMRRMNGNIERAAIVIGEDLEPSITSVVGFINTLVNGFVNLDDTTRKLIEMIMGAAGFVVALTAVANVVKMLSPGIVGLATAINGLGPAITTVTVAGKALTLSLGGILGIIGLVAAAAGLAYGAWRSYQEGQQQAALAGADNAKKLVDQRDRLRDLRIELEDLAAKTNPTVEEQNRLKQVTGEISRIAPEAASGINQITGRVEDLGKVLSGTTTAMDRLLSQSSILAKGAFVAAQGKLPELEAQQAKNTAEIDRLVSAIQSGPDATARALGYITEMQAGSDPLSALLVRGPEQLQREASAKVAKLVEESLKLQDQINQLRATAEAAKAILAPGSSGVTRTRSEADAQAYEGTPAAAPKGGTDGTGLFGGGKDAPTWISAWKSALEATMGALAPFEQALSGISGQMDILDAKQAYYLDLLESGKGGVEALAGAERARVEIIEQLNRHQDALHASNDANKVMIQQLAAEQRKLDDQLANGKITTKDHADASATLRKETDQLTDAIYQNSAAWWRDEQAIASAEAAAGRAQRTLEEARQKLNDQAYQQATGAMRHEVAMKRLSVDQQITLIRQMLREMTLSAEHASSLQEQLVGLYGQKIQTELADIQTAYQDAMDAVASDLETKLDDIEARLKKTIDPLKAELKDLEEQERSTDRTRATADHDRKIADLQEERRTHEKRIGREHREAIKRIDEQMAEENRRWQEQQDDWNLDDKKRAVQDKIDTAEDGAKKEREQAQKDAKQQREDLEAHYKQVRQITESGIMDTIAALSATHPEWFKTGETLIDQLIAGLQSGDFSGVLATINSVKTAADEAAAAAQRAAQSAIANKPGTTLATLDQVKALIASGQYLQAAQSLATVNGISLTQAKANIESIVGRDIPGFAKGAWEIPYDNMPARLHAGETVLPAYAAEAFRSFAPAVSNLDQVIMTAVERLIGVIQGRPAGNVTVYGAENAYLEDQTDMNLLSRQIARDVVRAQTVGG